MEPRRFQDGDRFRENQGDEPVHRVELFPRNPRERFEHVPHFLVIAPNLTVFERLKEDFKPEGGGSDIFDNDPLITVEWRGDWNLTTVLQDEAGGAHTGGVLYLTNIHRLFDNTNRRSAKGEAFDWMGPAVAKATALDTGAFLRDRITSHERVMVLNQWCRKVCSPGCRIG